MNEQKFEETSMEQPIVPKKKSGLATAGLVLGIVGICTSFIPIVNNASFVLGILAAVFGLIALIKKASLPKAIPAVILGILSIVITLAMQAAAMKAIDDAVDEFNEEMEYLAGDKTEDILKNYLDVTLGDFQVKEDDYWDETEMEVTLNNKGTEKKSFDVTVEAIDQDGNRITTDTVYVSDLGAGQRQKFKIFTLVTEEEIDDLKNATFRIVEASMY